MHLYNKIALIDKNILISFNIAFSFIAFQLVILYDLNQVFLLVPLALVITFIYAIWDTHSLKKSFVFVLILVLLFWTFIQNLSKSIRAENLEIIYNFYQVKCFKNFKNGFQTDLSQTDKSNLPKIRNESENYNIFFIETNHEREFLSSKQLCAIESAALNNPNAYVYVVSIRAELNQTYLQDTYKNIILIKLVPYDLFQDTPLSKWWAQRRVFKSPYFLAHVSDAVRLALVWKYGGFYSDLDTISVKDLSPLRKYSGFGFLYENEPSLGNGFIHFRAQHPFIYETMKNFADNYAAFGWGDNGPTLIIKTIKSFCNVDDLNKLIIKDANLNSYFSPNETSSEQRIDNNCDFGLYPESFFYPYNYRDDAFKLAFKTNSQLDLSRLINSYSIHFYGKFSSKLRVKLGDYSLYEFLAMTQCKRVYREIEHNLKYFDD